METVKIPARYFAVLFAFAALFALLLVLAAHPGSAQVTSIPGGAAGGGGGGSACAPFGVITGNVWGQYPGNLTFGFQNNQNPGWYASFGTQTPQNAAAPDCTNNGLTLVEDTSNNEHFTLTGLNYPLVVGQTVTYTVSCKNVVGTRNCALHIFNPITNGGLFIGVNPNTCAAVTGPSVTGNWSGAGFSCISLGGGWAQISLSGVVGETVDHFSADVSTLSGTTPIYVGNGTATNAWWGIAVSAQAPGEIAGAKDATAQSAAISGAAFFTPQVTGLYQISYTAKPTVNPTTSAVLGGTTGYVVSYTDGQDSTVQTLTLPAFSQTGATIAIATGNTCSAGACTATTSSGSAWIYAKAGSAVTYSFGYSSTGATAMQYEIRSRAGAN